MVVDGSGNCLKRSVLQPRGYAIPMEIRLFLSVQPGAKSLKFTPDTQKGALLRELSDLKAVPPA